MTEPDWWFKALSDFGSGLGFADAAEWRQDVLNLSVENGTYTIDVERSGEAILLAVLRRVPMPEVNDKALLLLQACGPQNDHPFFLQLGIKGEDVLVLAVRLYGRSGAPRMIGALEFIRKIYSQAEL